MLTGTLMFDISVEADNQKELERISREICSVLKSIKGITDTEEVDYDISDSKV